MLVVHGILDTMKGPQITVECLDGAACVRLRSDKLTDINQTTPLGVEWMGWAVRKCFPKNGPLSFMTNKCVASSSA